MIFVVLADAAAQGEVGSVLRDDGYVARYFTSSRVALRQSEHDAPDLIILDESLATSDGESVIETYQQLFPRRATSFLLLSDSPAAAAASALEATGATQRLSKSADSEALRAALASMMGYSSRKARDDLDPPSDSQRGKLSGIHVGGRTFHVQTEAQGRDASQISTVVVLDGQVRFKKTTEAPPDSTAEEIARRVTAQHEEVEQQIRDKLEGLRKSKTPEAKDLPSKWDLLKKASALVKANDFDGALAVLGEAREHYPDDSRWEINIRLVKRKMAELEHQKSA